MTAVAHQPTSATTVRPDAEAFIDHLVAELTAVGAVVLPPLVSAETLSDMQTAFSAQLRNFRFNNVDGYQRGELYRLTVDNVLTLSQGFVDIGLHPIVTGVIRRYVGPDFALCEAKGWQTQRTTTDFNSWHGDMWYDQTKIKNYIPREVKLAFFLTDVTSGAFQYIKGTHGRNAPFALSKSDKQQLPLNNMLEFKAKAGTAVLFDTSGIHRQGVPVLEPRRATFYNYHDPRVPVQKEDLDYYRYHPLILNAAFLGGLSQEQYRVLGFGNKDRFQIGYTRPVRHPLLHSAAEAANTLIIKADNLSGRVSGKLKRMLKR